MVSLGGDSGAFPPGSTVEFKTVHGDRVEGHVVCFDPTLKVLVIRDPTDACGKPVMRIFNLTLINEIKEVAAATCVESIENLLATCNTNPKKAAERIATLESRRRAELMPSDNISLAGQTAFLQLKHTIDDTRWDGQNIRVLGLVIVKPQYGERDAEVIQKELGSESDEAKARNALAQVKKILSKPFNVDRQRPSFTA